MENDRALSDSADDQVFMGSDSRSIEELLHQQQLQKYAEDAVKLPEIKTDVKPKKGAPAPTRWVLLGDVTVNSIFSGPIRMRRGTEFDGVLKQQIEASGVEFAPVE